MDRVNYNVGMYIIDSNYEMVYLNPAVTEMYPEVKVGDICYKALAGLDEPCAHCPKVKTESLFYNPNRKEWIAAQAADMEIPGRGLCHSIHFQLKQRMELPKEVLGQEELLEEHVADLHAGESGECLIGGYCEEGFPIFYLNNDMAKLMGYDSKEELIDAIDGMVINTIHPDDRAQVKKDLGDSYYPGMVYETMYRMPRKDGTWFWTVDRGKVIETKSGKLAIISICVDMSKYMERQWEIQSQNEELKKKDYFSNARLNNMPGGYHCCAAEKGCPFLFVSEQFEKIVGWTHEDIKNKFDNLYVNMLWPEDVNAIQVYNDMLKMRGKGNSYSTNIYRVKHKDGGYRWVLDSTMFVDLGEESFYQATISDITAFVEAQETHRREIEDAMHRVEDANNAKTQFLSSMSHDIRTPMNAIIGMTTLAMKHLDDPNYMQGCLKKVTLASHHLLTLINDVLDISKVESGKMTLIPIVFSLAESVGNLMNIVRQQISGKKQQFDVRVHNIYQEYLFADELRLNQIFINILSNAVKYTPEGGTISVDLKQEIIKGLPGMVRVIYVVKDNGIGMSKEFQKDMYSSFARANSANYGTMQGTGLGLTICKQMIDLMNGTIECESELGKGTTFTITLDLPVADKITDELILPPMEVLLVDDDEIFLESATDTLRSLGMSPDCATSGKEALTLTLERHNKGKDYSVIIVDWKMPEMDGIDTIRAIRAQVGQEVSIIVVSAYEWTEIEDAAREAGADGFISKPFFPSSVYQNMTQILGIEREEKKGREDDWQEIIGMHVLVAEDNDLNWEIAKEILNMYGITTVRAENGQECVNMIYDAQDGEYDLILMDIKMPVMDGYDAAKAIRSSDRDFVRNIPIVAMTADAFSDDIRKCLDVGMNAHIAKPINVTTLLTILKNGGTR